MNITTPPTQHDRFIWLRVTGTRSHTFPNAPVVPVKVIRCTNAAGVPVATLVGQRADRLIIDDPWKP